MHEYTSASSRPFGYTSTMPRSTALACTTPTASAVASAARSNGRRCTASKHCLAQVNPIYRKIKRPNKIHYPQSFGLCPSFPFLKLSIICHLCLKYSINVFYKQWQQITGLLLYWNDYQRNCRHPRVVRMLKQWILSDDWLISAIFRSTPQTLQIHDEWLENAWYSFLLCFLSEAKSKMGITYYEDTWGMSGGRFMKLKWLFIFTPGSH